MNLPGVASGSKLLGLADVRHLVQTLDVAPTKKLGQNFVHDPGTIRKIVGAAGVLPGETVIEVGPGLGSLTLGILETGANVGAIEIDPRLAEALLETVGQMQPEASERINLVNQDALAFQDLGTLIRPTWPAPTHLIANLPYNVAVPILLHLLAEVTTLKSVLVMVQAEVADRLCASPGSKVYGAPSVKAAWYGTAKRAGTVGRQVFWPEPNVDSALVKLQCYSEQDCPRLQDTSLRHLTFALIDIAFGSRRKMLRAALRNSFGSSQEAENFVVAAGIDPTQRGETLDIDQFVALAKVVRAEANASNVAAQTLVNSVQEGYRGA